MNAITADVLPGSVLPLAAQAVAKDTWTHVLEELPRDGEVVQILCERSKAIRRASRGFYQSTGAWFDAQTRRPIYESVTHWRVPEEQL